MSSSHCPVHSGLCALAILVTGASGRSDESERLEERPQHGQIYRVRTRVQLSGQLTMPAEKDKPAPKPVTVQGESAIDYDERLLEIDRDGKVAKAVRVFRRVDFERQLGTTPQKTTLRPEVRRVVLVRLNSTEVAFSPDGPLTWGEIDLLRTDVFTPALAGLLPNRGVKIGDRWKASLDAVRELTDLEQIEHGGIDCQFDRLANQDGRRVARVSLSGTVQGAGEDGPTRQQFDGNLLFDRETNQVVYLALNAKRSMLDGEGRIMGKVEGRFVLDRQPLARSTELSDEALRGVALEANADNTRLLYENADLRLTFLHPRRWRVSGVRGHQVTLDSADGQGLLLTVEAAERMPTGQQYLAESRDWLEKQKARILRTNAPRALVASPFALEQFGIEAELGGQRVLLDYYVARQAAGGATLAARLPSGEVEALRKEVEGIARSVRIGTGR